VRKSRIFAALVLALALAGMFFTPASATEFVDQFDNLNNWTIHKQASPGDANRLIDSSFGMPPPSLFMPGGRNPAGIAPGFDDNVTSIFLSNPDTSKLSNFTLSFWIYFDTPVGRAIVTFRMQDQRNYYALVVCDTIDWKSEFLKFTNDQPSIIRQTQASIFLPETWSHVQLGLFKDGNQMLTAIDNQWSSGVAFGIGLYNGYYEAEFHIDDFDLVTPEPLTYVSLITQLSTTSSVIWVTYSTTSTIQLTYLTYTTSTNRTTTKVSLFAPQIDWSTSALIILLGVAVGLAEDREQTRDYAAMIGTCIGAVIVLYALAIGASALWLLGDFIFAFVSAKFGSLIFKHGSNSYTDEAG
jgi:hypothetical protein